MALPLDPEAIAAYIQEQVAANMQANRYRLKPIKPEAFFGDSTKDDVDLWLFLIEQWLLAGYVNVDTEKIVLATGLLRGAALTWWRSLYDAPNTPSTWVEFKTQIRAAFQPINPIEDARDRLARLRQNTSVNAYASIFRKTVLEIPSITDDEKKDRFIRGLKRRTLEHVRVRNPDTFEEAVQIASRYDSLLASYGRFENQRSNRPNNYSIRQHQGPIPMELGAIYSSNSNRANNGGSYTNHNKNGYGEQRPKLTPELRSQLMKEGKCFFCRKPGHRAIECQEKRRLNPS